MIPVTLNHIALDVVDAERSAAFYRALLGAEIAATDPANRATFLRLPNSASFSDIALHEHPQFDDAYPAGHLRMAHTGWAVDAVEHLVAAYDFFNEHTRVVLAVDVTVARSVMGIDPDGHVVEFELFEPDAAGRQPGFVPLDIDALRA
jgi:catechol 2,3-dioxygenase-like lactoylglutathione lyase family enzyme